MKKRVLSAVLLGTPLLLFLFIGPPWALEAVVLAVSLLGMREFCLLSLNRWRWRWLPLGALPILGALWGLEGLCLGTALGLGGSFALGTFRSPPAEGLKEAVTVAAGVSYIPFPLAHLVLIGDLPYGMGWLGLLLAALWTGDTLALLVGRRWGKRPLAPKLSPAKTVEGALATFAGVGLAAVVTFALFLPRPTPLQISLLILGLGSLGQLGDLTESLLKRAAGVKDSGRLIPGHGGMLDRLDSFLLTSPFLYYFLKAF